VSADGALLWVATLAAGIVGGGQFFVLLAIVPLKRNWPDSLRVPFHQQVLSISADKLLRPILGVAFVAGVAAILVHHDVDGVSGVAMIVGAAACVGVMITSLRGNFRINQEISHLDPTAQGQYEPLGRRWDVAHTIRTTCGMTAFVAYLLATATL
jgi:hypothetical protein